MVDARPCARRDRLGALTLAVRVALKAPLTAAFGANSVGDGIRYFAVVLMAGTLWPMTFGWFSLMGRKK